MSTEKWCAYPDPTCPGSELRFGILAGDGLASICVAPADAGPQDAGIADAGPDDAMSSDGPLGPYLVSGQDPDIVFGQQDFESSFANAGGRSAASLSCPSAAFEAGGHFFIVDAVNARVLVRDDSPAVASTTTVVVGQSSASSKGVGPTQTILGNGNELCFYMDASLGGTKLVVSDPSNNRVLVWAGVPTVNGAPATLVLGQSSFTTKLVGDSASQMNNPAGVWTDGTKLAVADAQNNRVLLWDTFPTQNGQAATHELGWSAFGLGNGDPVISPPTSRSLALPMGVLFDGQHLFVSDFQNCRILVWNGWPTSNNQAAAFVIGQTGFDTNSLGAASAATMCWPGHLSIHDGRLLVPEQGHQRVLVFDPIPQATGASASFVLGQADFTSSVFSDTPARSNMSYPTGASVADGYLWVADAAFNRVLGFKLYPQAQ